MATKKAAPKKVKTIKPKKGKPLNDSGNPGPKNPPPPPPHG